MSPNLVKNLMASCASTTILLYLELTLGSQLWGLSVLSLPLLRQILYFKAVQLNLLFSRSKLNHFKVGFLLIKETLAYLQTRKTALCYGALMMLNV